MMIPLNVWTIGRFSYLSLKRRLVAAVVLQMVMNADDHKSDLCGAAVPMNCLLGTCRVLVSVVFSRAVTLEGP